MALSAIKKPCLDPLHTCDYFCLWRVALETFDHASSAAGARYYKPCCKTSKLHKDKNQQSVTHLYTPDLNLAFVSLAFRQSPTMLFFFNIQWLIQLMHTQTLHITMDLVTFLKSTASKHQCLLLCLALLLKAFAPLPPLLSLFLSFLAIAALPLAGARTFPLFGPPAYTLEVL